MPDERNVGAEQLFKVATAAVANAEQIAYLGDKVTVDAVLRLAAVEALDLLEKLEPGESFGREVYKIGVREMRVFLEENPSGHKGVRGWNKPGAIDLFVEKWTGVTSDRPIGRLAGMFLAMIEELVELEKVAKTGKTEQWDWQVEEVFDRYTLLLLGFTPAQQALMM